MTKAKVTIEDLAVRASNALEAADMAVKELKEAQRVEREARHEEARRNAEAKLEEARSEHDYASNYDRRWLSFDSPFYYSDTFTARIFDREELQEEVSISREDARRLRDYLVGLELD